MELSGNIKVIFDKQTFDSGFEKREFVVTTQEQYPQDIKFELYKEKCAALDSFKVEDEVTVHFNLRGNEYNERYYVNLNAWKIDRASDVATTGQSVAAPGAPKEAIASQTESPFGGGGDDLDDLPF